MRKAADFLTSYYCKLQYSFKILAPITHQDSYQTVPTAHLVSETDQLYECILVMNPEQLPEVPQDKCDEDSRSVIYIIYKSQIK